MEPHGLYHVYEGYPYVFFALGMHRLRKIFNIGELKQLRAKRADLALARGVRRGPRGWPPQRGCKGAAPPCVRKFCVL